MTDYSPKPLAEYFCRAQGVRATGPNGVFTMADVDTAWAVLSMKATRAVAAAAAAQSDDDDEFAALFPPTGNQVEASAEDDEFSPLFPPPGTPWA